jgi:hypothetical protein
MGVVLVGIVLVRRLLSSFGFSYACSDVYDPIHKYYIYIIM